MENCNFQGKFPIITREFLKSEIQIETLDGVCSYFMDRIKQNPVAKHIATFDHYAHTKSIVEGMVGENIVGAKNIIFCFGKKLIDPKMLSVRPRSIGVCETGSHFVVSFLEAPNPELTETMRLWLRELELRYMVQN